MTDFGTAPQEQDDVVFIGPKKVQVWPHGQSVQGRNDGVIAMTRFEDHADYHPALIRKVMELYDSPDVKKAKSVSASGTKIHYLDVWGSPEAELLNARAMAFFRRVFKKETAVIHIGWANVTGRGEYSMPHTHPDSTASIVYSLEVGDPNPADPLDGQLAFVDARYNACCRDNPEFMTTPFMPKMPPGTMIIFPSTLVHCVNPYGGTRPRITFAWDLNEQPVGRPPLPEDLFDAPQRDAP